MTTPTTSDVVRAGEAPHVQIMDFSARALIAAARTGGAFALVEHGIGPRGLAAPVHTHTREDEYTYVLEGRLGCEIGGRTLTATAGDVVFKPRNMPHAMWNPSDEPTRILEIIAPGGMEEYFTELARLMPPAVRAPDFAALQQLTVRYGIEMDMSSVGRLAEAHGLLVPEPPAGA